MIALEPTRWLKDTADCVHFAKALAEIGKTRFGEAWAADVEKIHDEAAAAIVARKLAMRAREAFVAGGSFYQGDLGGDFFSHEHWVEAFDACQEEIPRPDKDPPERAQRRRVGVIHDLFVTKESLKEYLSPAAAAGTIAAEKRCELALVEMMRAAPDRPQAKKRIWATHFSDLPWRAFERAWALAIKASGAVKWGLPGPRNRSGNHRT